ncbi:hypothetical protein C4K00_2901 [Pseudomonas synxantha]|uniref:hypothetical protein n=1 Tax=Pseudomonas TaxID=286 RepID=UPI000702F6B0|nr:MULTISPECIES: hypothetical protein [Pseudomonas]AMS22077.1 hypothetical protein AYK59_18780 [Pseudomonas synxantha]AZE73129.1 hypothetical protein C4K00_2901 [Pseudomonas synxantha]KRA06285.1 hypothetical protein ASD70_15420 [Pseudomonas sp. Root569]
MPEENTIPDETWSVNEELVNCDSFDELLAENDDLEVGATVWKGERFPVDRPPETQKPRIRGAFV